MKNGKREAVRSLYPGAGIFEITVDGAVTFRKSDPKNPTQAQIDAEEIRLNSDAVEGVRLLRKERDNRLAKCDWRASSDLTISDDWKSYRQALRDLPALSTPKLDSNDNLDLTSVEWPSEPSS